MCVFFWRFFLFCCNLLLPQSDKPTSVDCTNLSCSPSEGPQGGAAEYCEEKKHFLECPVDKVEDLFQPIYDYIPIYIHMFVCIPYLSIYLSIYLSVYLPIISCESGFREMMNMILNYESHFIQRQTENTQIYIKHKYVYAGY